MSKYTPRQRKVLITAVRKAKEGLVSFISYLSTLSDDEQQFLKERFGIDTDEAERLRFI